MKVERWRRVETLFAGAQSLDADNVEAYLREHCGGDETLEQEVASLLRHHRSEGSALNPEGAPWQRLLRELAGSASLLTAESVSAAEKIGDDIGPYRLMRLIGRGGMGSVWYAERRDRLMSRGVALKLPLGYGEQLASRFAREREIVAKLTHPNIARLYDAGISTSGQAYLALEYIEGKSLCDYCDEQKLPVSARLNLFRQVLSAVQYAHSRLVIHRDLKPTNILVTREGQVALLDFGVAKMLVDESGADVELTRSGVAAMTLAYASPEQIAGESVSIAADIYSLGVILFELLVGARPYRAKHLGPGALENAILRSDIPLPSASPLTESIAVARATSVRELRRELRGDLDAITLMALQRQPERRYATAAAFAEDLVRQGDGHAVSAHRPSRWYRWRKFAWRNRIAVAGVGVASVALLVLTGVALWQAQMAAHHEARTAIVRDFMFDLIDDAEPDELRPNAQVTGKQMLDGAVVRAHQHFGNQPALQGELLSELGRMYVRLGETDSAKPLFVEAAALLERNAPPNDAALNKARARLALVLLAENDVDGARALADRARDSCTRQTNDCAKARAYANSVLSRIALLGGNVEQALFAMRQAVDETALGFGATDQESAMALLNLALIARNAGQLREAGSAMSRALAISQGQTFRAADRTQLLRTAAVIDLDLGRYESAQRRLSDLLSTTTARTERALQLRLLANAQLAIGDPVSARQTAESAIALADGNKPNAEVLYAHQVHAQSLALLGQSEQPLDEIQTVIQGLRSLGRSDESPEALRAHRIRGEILLRIGLAEEAYRELESLSTKLVAASEAHPLELGQTLDLLGCALRELNRQTEAVIAHDRARIQLASQLPTNHPFLSRNVLYRDAAANDRERFKQQALQTETGLAPASIWRSLIDAQWDPSVCTKPELRTCVFVL